MSRGLGQMQLNTSAKKLVDRLMSGLFILIYLNWDAFNQGDWDEAFALLHGIPYWDQGADFLTSHILRHQRQPPSGWDGVIQIESK